MTAAGVTAVARRVLGGAVTARRAAPSVVAALVAALLLPPGAPARAADLSAQVGATDPGRAQQWALDLLDAEAAWEAQRADDVVVAVLDTGVDAAHEDLIGTVLAGFDAVDGGGSATQDPVGHGTQVAGIIAATVANGVGIAGLAPGARILPVRVVGDGGALGADIAEGLEWAVVAGADVVNLSLGSIAPDAAVREAIDRTVRRGVVVVASAGNVEDARTLVYPAADSDVVSVAALDRDLRRAPFSASNAAVDLAAPGVEILTTEPDGGYGWVSGTSFAAPHVAATAALLVARHPRATPTQTVERLVRTARDLGASGRDDESGEGLIRPLAALQHRPDAGCRLVDYDPLMRVYDTDRIGTAASAACTFWPAGTTDHAVLARADLFPDALAGTPLAAAAGGPLLLTRSGALPPVVLQVLTQLGVSRVTVLGGSAAVGQSVVDELEAAGIAVERAAGRNRAATAAQAARRAAEREGTVDRVLVVADDGFADAVAAGAYLSEAPAAPLLLSGRDRLPPETQSALTDLEPEEIVVVGGTDVVGAAVEAALSAYAPAVRRVSGPDRYATSAAVLADVAPAEDEPLVLATGADFPDALAAGGVTARLGGALLLVSPSDAGRSAAVVADGGWDRGVLLGGEAAVDAEGAAALAAALSTDGDGR